MKKTLSIVLALVLAISMIASLALVPSAASKPDALTLKGIMVTNAAGFAAPYSAVDEASPFSENQAAYVIVSFEVAKSGDTDYATFSGNDSFQLDITSSTLDLSYADDTAKFVVNANNAIRTYDVPTTFGETYDSVAADKVVIKSTHRSSAFGGFGPMSIGFYQTNAVSKYAYAFVAVTKPATAGEVKAAMKVAATGFELIGTIFSSTDMDANHSKMGYDTAAKALVVYDAGVAKYTIVRRGDDKTSYDVFSGKSISKASFLFTYKQANDKFEGIAKYDSLMNLVTLSWSYDGKLIDLGDDGALGTPDDKDYTATVAAVNTFFGFSFAYNNAASDSDFKAKTGGNPVTVSDTYNYVTAVVPGDDTTDDVAQTGDFSANIVIVMAASAILAAAALAFVAKKARD